MRLPIFLPVLLLILLMTELLVRFSAEVRPDSLARAQLRASSQSPVHEEPSATRFTHALSQYTYKPQDLFRVAVVGDTFAFPDAVGYDDSFTLRLERMLQSKAGGTEKPRAEVLRFGEARLTALQKISYVRKAAQADPDLLLVELDFDDPSFDGSDAPSVNVRTSAPWLSGTVLEHWQTLSCILDAVQRKIDESTRVRARLKLFAQTETWNNLVDSLKLMRQFAAEQDISLVVVLFPCLDATPSADYPYAGLHRKLAEQLSNMHIPSIDLLPAYSGIPLSRLQAGETQEGNEVAQRIAAEAIYFRLEKSGFLGRTLTPKRNPGGDSAILSSSI